MFAAQARTAAGVAGALLLLISCSPALAAQPAITGQLSAPGFDVIAVDDAGRAVVARPGSNGQFRVVPTASTVTLQLRSTTGRYGGPVVVAGAPSQKIDGRTYGRVVVGVRAGARLGRIDIGDGFARTTRDASSRSIVTSRRAYTRGRKKPKPSGSKNTGYTNKPSTGTKGGQSATERRPGADLDQDGVPNGIDVDDDGDLVLDNVDRTIGGYAPGSLESPYQVVSLLNWGIEESYLAERQGLATGISGYPLNVYTRPPGVDFEDYQDIALRTHGLLLYPIPTGGSSELDCATLSYCSAGGSGRDLTRFKLFPSNFDPDGDGFGLMDPAPPFNPGRDGFGTTRQLDPGTDRFALAPSTVLRRSERGAVGLATGDTYVERTAAAGAERDRTVTLSYAFVTTPVITAYDNNTGTPGGKGTLRYPLASGEPGSEANPLIGGTRLTLTVLRPQRPAYPGEAGCPVEAAVCDEYVDIGGLTYVVAGKTNEAGRKTFFCSASAYSVDARDLETSSRGVEDRAPDRPLGRDNTVTFTVDLRSCPNADGSPLTASRDLYVAALTRAGDAVEGGGISFK